MAIDWERPVETTEGRAAKRVYVGSVNEPDKYEYFPNLVVYKCDKGDDEDVAWINEDGSSEDGTIFVRNTFEFKVEKPGRYRMRSGDVVEVVKDGDDVDGYCWMVSGSNYDNKYRFSNGAKWSFRQDIEDLIEYVGPLGSESAGLTGQVWVWPEGNEAGMIAPENLQHASNRGFPIIDLSKVPASAIVKPEPKRETRKVWLKVWQEGSVTTTVNEPTVDQDTSPLIVAIVEHDIVFTHGDGLQRVG